MRRLVRARREGQQDRIRPHFGGARHHRRDHVGGGRVERDSTEPFGKPESVTVGVDADHAATACPQQLHREKPDEAEAVDDHRLAERRRREAHALQSDGGERREGGDIEGHAIGNTRDERAWNRDVLGVCAVAHDASAWLERHRRRAALDDHAGVAVAEGHRFRELALHGFERDGDAVRPRLVEYLAHLLGLLTDLRDHVRAPELYEHALGPSRDDGRTSLDQHARPAHRGDRGFFQERRAAVEAMQQYFHGFCMLSMFPAKRVGSGACASFATGCPARAEV